MLGQNNKEIFEIGVGESIEVDVHTITFVGVKTDSRCPKEVNCITAGYADIEVDLGYKRKIQHLNRKVSAVLTDVNRPFLLGVPSKNIKVEVGALKPYPLSTDVFEDRNYVLEVWVFDN